MSLLLDVAGLPRSTYYYCIKKQKEPEKYVELKEEICSIAAENKGRYGYRRVTQELRNRGFHYNHKLVMKLMKQLGLSSKVRVKKYRSYKGEVGKIAPNLLNRDFHAEKPNQKWVTDVTEFSLFGEKLYLSPILDLCSSDLVSYTISDRPVLSMVTTMLDEAFAKIPAETNLILHSDQGWQYQHKQYQQMLREKGVRQSMSRKGNCLDNAVIENFFGLLKSELLYLQEFQSMEHFKQELIEYELVPEDWGGSTIFCPVSAHTGEGIDELLDMVSLTAEVLELKANPNRKARGIVLEAQLDKGRGPVATVLVQKGTLHVGDAVAIGSAHGKVRAMINDKGKRIKTAGPSTPVEILGLSEVPNAGEVMMVMDSEKEARSVAEKFIAYGREKMLSETKQQLSLDDLFNQIQAGSVKELNIIVKADVQGSVEAVKQSLVKLSNDEVAVKVIHGGVGAITESDVNLAAASNAIIIGFNVRPEPAAKDAASAEKVDLRLYRVIYNAIEDIEAAMKGMLDPEFVEKVTGHAEVRQIFKASGVGTIAGSYVLDGTIQRDSSARIIRDGIVVHEGKLASIQRGKDAVKEVRSGFECGLVMESYNDIKEGDQIESFIMEEVPR